MSELPGKAKINPFQIYLSADYRLNAEGLMVQNIAPKETHPALGRFLEKVSISDTSFHEGSPCWEWIGCKQSNGYGQFKADGRRGAKKTSPHRFAYECYVSSIPEGHEVDHLCKNRGCCNPQHLEAITVQENRRRRNADQTHCKHGHEYTKDNTYYRPNGKRNCRLCNGIRQAEWQQKHKTSSGRVI